MSTLQTLAKLPSATAEFANVILSVPDAQIGQTPKDTVWTHRNTTLYRCRSDQREHRVAILLVFALINRPFPNRSLFLGVWVATVTYVIVALTLLIVYLPHLSRSRAAPENRVLWTIVLLFFGPIAMSYYWIKFMRPRSM